MKKLRTRARKLNGLDKYVIYCIVFFTLFVVAELITSSICGESHDTLINAVKWFCGGEVFLCAMIKRHKLKNEADRSLSDSDPEGGYYDD